MKYGKALITALILAFLAMPALALDPQTLTNTASGTAGISITAQSGVQVSNAAQSTQNLEMGATENAGLSILTQNGLQIAKGENVDQGAKVSNEVAGGASITKVTLAQLGFGCENVDQDIAAKNKISSAYSDTTTLGVQEGTAKKLVDQDIKIKNALTGDDVTADSAAIQDAAARKTKQGASITDTATARVINLGDAAIQSATAKNAFQKATTSSSANAFGCGIIDIDHIIDQTETADKAKQDAKSSVTTPYFGAKLLTSDQSIKQQQEGKELDQKAATYANDGGKIVLETQFIGQLQKGTECFNVMKQVATNTKYTDPEYLEASQGVFQQQTGSGWNIATQKAKNYAMLGSGVLKATQGVGQIQDLNGWSKQTASDEEFVWWANYNKNAQGIAQSRTGSGSAVQDSKIKLTTPAVVSDNTQLSIQKAEGLFLTAYQKAKLTSTVPSSVSTKTSQESDQYFNSWFGNSKQCSSLSEKANAALAAITNQYIGQDASSLGHHIQNGANNANNNAWLTETNQGGHQTIS
jgi:hypothetical protein